MPAPKQAADKRSNLVASPIYPEDDGENDRDPQPLAIVRDAAVNMSA